MLLTEKIQLEALTLIRLGGVELSLEDKDWLSGTETLNPERQEYLTHAAFRGFFHAVTDGHLFVAHEEIEEEYGKPVHENYPEGGVEFLDMARNYWTLKILVDAAVTMPSPASSLLLRVERIIGPLFFPTPGPMRVPPQMRERDQRAMIEWSGAPIDIDEFMLGNAILIRDRAR